MSTMFNPETPFRCLGLDLGQSNDYTACALLEWKHTPEGFIGAPDLKIRCKYLRRWPLGSDYTDIVDEVLSFDRIDLVVVDYGGVGRAVVDLMRKQSRSKDFRARIRPVAIVGASVARVRLHKTERGTNWTVPKPEIVTAINLVVQSRQLSLPACEETDILMQELKNFQLKQKSHLNPQFEARTGEHDDLVLAFGLACWWRARFGRRQPAVYIGD